MVTGGEGEPFFYTAHGHGNPLLPLFLPTMGGPRHKGDENYD